MAPVSDGTGPRSRQTGIDPLRGMAGIQLRFGVCCALLGALSLVAHRATADSEADAQPPSAPVAAEDIVVAAQKLDVETLIDRKVYSVATDVQSTFGTLSDILSVIPSVDVDGNGLVSLRGDTNVLILIDGKAATQLSGTAAGDNLQSIAAKDIERIEVLTTPPAQFKADGAAGVINIITRKKRTPGITGSTQGGLGNGGRSAVASEASYVAGPLAASVTAGYRHDIRQRLIQSDVTSPVAGSAQPAENTSAIRERIRRGVPTASAAASYALNDRQSVSGSLNGSERGGLRTYTETNETLAPGAAAPGAATAGAARRLSAGHDPETDLDAKLGFAQQLRSPDETLNFSLQRATSRQHEHYFYRNDSIEPPAPAFFSNLNFQENHATTEAAADYALNLSTTTALKAGYAFEDDAYRFTSSALNIDAGGGAPVNDDFSFRQQIHALYGSYQARRHAWSWIAGLRAELTQARAEQLTTRAATPSHYFDLYPSLHVDRSLTEESTLSFGASRRVTRPDPDTLNPYVDHEYTPNLRAGNPELRPQFTQSYEAGYGFDGHRLSYGVTGYYRLNRDSVTDVTTYLGNGESLSTKTNLPRNDSAGLEFTSNGRMGHALSFSLSGNLFYTQIDATSLGAAGLKSTVGLDAKIKLNYRPTADDSAQLSMTRTDKRLTPQGEIGAINIVNLGYRRQLRSDFTAVITLSDLFEGQRLQRFVSTPTFTERYQRSVLGRVVYVGVVYSFGVATKKDKAPTFEYEPSN